MFVVLLNYSFLKYYLQCVLILCYLYLGIVKSIIVTYFPVCCIQLMKKRHCQFVCNKVLIITNQRSGMFVLRIGTASVRLSVNPIAAKRFKIFKICFHHSIHIITGIQTSYYGQNRLTGTRSKVRGQTCFFHKTT